LSASFGVIESVAEERLWEAVDALVDRSRGLADLRAHGLQLIAAARLRELGREIPTELAEEKRRAAARVLAAPVVLERVRAACDGPLLLMKGYEVALRYQDPTLRPFSDIDLLASEPERAFRSLTNAGFEAVGFPEDHYDRLHHLRPVCLPSLPLVIEIHRKPVWIPWSPAPSVDELLEHAVPSRTGLDGLLTLDPGQHALAVAAHSWAEAPLRKIVDVIDCALLSSEAGPGAVDEWARRWDLQGLWNFVERVQDVLLDDRRTQTSLPRWSRSTLQVRDATVLEQHERRLLAPFSVLPYRRALVRSLVELGNEVRPEGGESWAAKLRRMGLALRNAFTSRSRHDAELNRRRPTG
jgi:hypothetical protein